MLAGFYLYELLKHAAKSAWPQAAEAMGAPARGARPSLDRSYTSNLFWSRIDYPEFAVTAREMSLAVLVRINDLCARAGIRFVLVTIPTLEQVYVPSAFGDGYDPQLPQRYIAEFARARGVPYLDLLLALQGHVERGADPYYRGDGHLRNEGHRIVGELVADFLRQDMDPR